MLSNVRIYLKLSLQFPASYFMYIDQSRCWVRRVSKGKFYPCVHVESIEDDDVFGEESLSSE